MNTLKEFWNDETGAGVVEVILVLVVLISLVIIFKSKITTIVNNIFSTMTTDVNKVIK